MTERTGILRMRVGAATTALAMFVAANAAGQSDLDRFTIGGQDAAVAKSSVEISLETARQIIDVCLKFAREHEESVSVFILEPSGQIVASARMDGQVPNNVETALMKAKTALYMRDSTGTWSNRLHDNLETEVRWLPIGQLWMAGGLPIVVDGQLIGAIGAGGSHLAEDCAYAGLTEILGPQPPLEPLYPPPQGRLPEPVPHPD